VLLLPRELEAFVQRDQAQDLLRAPNVVAVDPPRLPYGAYGRLPMALADALAATQARRLLRSLRRRGGEPRVVVIFHPLQYPLARTLVGRTGAEVWYGRWDRYERAPVAGARMRTRLEELHSLAAQRAELIFVASDELVRLEREAGRDALLATNPADSFPAVDPQGTVVAVSLGHLGHRNDWALVRAVADELDERLVLLLIGRWYDDECGEDPDYRACREHPSLVWLGHRSDAEAARLILAADVGVVPFKRDDFNDAGLPNRILKYARLGRRSVSLDLPGVRTWERAVTAVPDAPAFARALLEHAGARARPDLELREWALRQNAASQNAPLWDRLEALGIAVRG
jgi:hypothetical protein